MGLFRTTIELRNWERQGSWRALPDTLVDTGSEYTWIPRHVLEEVGVIAQRKQGFIVADGRRIDRDIGYALVRAGGSEAPDLVVFAEEGDMSLLGAHSLEGMNLKIDPVRKALVPAGPVIAAANSPHPFLNSPMVGWLIVPPLLLAKLRLHWCDAGL